MDVEFNWNKPVKQVAEEKAGGKKVCYSLPMKQNV